MAGFSAGPRTCIGKHLALLDSKICFTKILKRYKKIIVPEADPILRISLGVSLEPFSVELMK